jgi:hypothetical protein
MPEFPDRALVAHQPLTERSFDMTRGFFLTFSGLLLMIGLTATPPAHAGGSVSVDIQITPPPVVVTAPPSLVVIPGTPVSYAPSAPVNYFTFGGRFYTFHNRAWFSATVFNGPWVYVPVEQVPPPVLAVPVKYYKSPPPGPQVLFAKHIEAGRVHARVIYAKHVDADGGQVAQIVEERGPKWKNGPKHGARVKANEVSAEVIYAEHLKAGWIEAAEVHAEHVRIGR